MSIATTREQRRQLARDNAKLPVTLQLVPRDQWEHIATTQTRIWRSRDYLVQEYAEPLPAIVRLSILRTQMSGDRWKDGISWDELQRLKNEVGYADHDAVEIYPAARDVVNVANIRHLWVMDQPLPFTWRRKL
jgi:hypothetical protein